MCKSDFYLFFFCLYLINFFVTVMWSFDLLYEYHGYTRIGLSIIVIYQFRD